jgi:hypothetical protein
MKRILLGLAIAALTASTAAADPGGFAPPPGGPGYASPAGHTGTPDTLIGAMGAGPTRAPDRYGLLPGLRKLFTLDKGCSTCGESHGNHRGGCPRGGCAPGGPGYSAYPPANQGTLVFPHHPYVRSPRDFFMYEPGR